MTENAQDEDRRRIALEARDEADRLEAEQNLAEFRTPYNPYTDTAARIHYLNAKFGPRGWATFLKKIEDN